MQRHESQEKAIDQSLAKQRLTATSRNICRWTLLVVAIVQCSCQSLATKSGQPQPPGSFAGAPVSGIAPSAGMHANNVPGYGVQQAAYYPPSLPPSAFTGAPMMPSYGCSDGCGPALGGNAGCATGACGMRQDWRPPGIGGLWPEDEYICDGGDHQPSVEVMRDWTVMGLDQEDTVAHYDTVKGQTEVEAANRVCIYAPRFAAVRQVSGIVINQHRERSAGFDLPTGPIQHEDQNLASTMHQPIQPGRYLGLDGSQSFRDTSRTVAANMGILIDQLTTRFKAYEDFQVIRAGIFDASEKVRLANSLAAAHAWTTDQAVQVVLDEVKASVASGRSRVQSVYEYEMPDGKPRLRVVKVASDQQAQPGDEIEFTIRFDNVGDQTIGNVTLVDNLTTRLEYVPDTAECQPAANFFTQQNDGESLVLRWEIVDPLKVGEGGLIRFRCRVR